MCQWEVHPGLLLFAGWELVIIWSLLVADQTNSQVPLEPSSHVYRQKNLAGSRCKSVDLHLGASGGKNTRMSLKSRCW